ncbi:MAG: hypothetical protein AAF708_11975 [Deinococcota bacterium]|jgi:hypothetical protein
MFETDFTVRLVKDHIRDLEQLRGSIEAERLAKRNKKLPSIISHWRKR